MRTCRTWLLAAATAFISLLNIVWFCRSCNKGEACEHEEVAAPVAPEQEHLLTEEDRARVDRDEGVNGLDERAGSRQLSINKQQTLLRRPSSSASKNGTTFDPTLEDVSNEQQAVVATEGDVDLQVEQQEPVAPVPLQAASEQPIDEGYLQHLIDQELGPPKFSVPKQSEADDNNPSSLQDLIERELGPPKFSIMKSADEGHSSPAKHRNSPDLPHIRLEVLTGPAAGKIFDTTDTTTEVRIGRTPDATCSILDQEISARHAALQYSERDKYWMIMDAGSMNGTLLNGIPISHEQMSGMRQPGQQYPLSDQDVLEFGTVTRVKVTCSPSYANKRQHTGDADDAATGSSGGSPRRMQSRSRSHSLQVLSTLGPHMAMKSFVALKLNMAVHQRQGSEHKRANTGCEDVVHYECPFPPYTNAGIFCVFDGHHGSKAAVAAKDLVPAMLKEKLEGQEGMITGRSQDEQEKMMKELFLEVDAKMSEDEGCTATLVMVERGVDGELLIQTANVGDSSAVLVNVTTSESCKLSDDHRIASSRAERERLQQRGHTVKTRLYGLNISRMLGDRFLKNEDLGFIAEPHVSQPTAVAAGDRAFLILASDGLWDVVTEARAGQLVLRAVSEDPEVSPMEIADIMLTQAITLRSKDDITVLVLETRP